MLHDRGPDYFRTARQPSFPRMTESWLRTRVATKEAADRPARDRFPFVAGETRAAATRVRYATRTDAKADLRERCANTRDDSTWKPTATAGRSANTSRASPRSGRVRDANVNCYAQLKLRNCGNSTTSGRSEETISRGKERTRDNRSASAQAWRRVQRYDSVARILHQILWFFFFSFSAIVIVIFLRSSFTRRAA